MDQRAHVRRAFHGVGQPRVQGELRALPTAPPNRRSGIKVRSWGVSWFGYRDAIFRWMSTNESVSKTFQITRTPTRNATSPTRVTRNAFFAAAAASGLWYQKPISRYEQSPMISQKIRSWRKLSALTVPSIPVANRLTSA